MGNRARLLTVTLALGLLTAGLTSESSAKTDPAPTPESISVSASRPVLLVGQQTRISGAVKPRNAYAPLGLQRKVTGGWKNVARTEPNARGRYRFTVQPRTGGVFRYRVIELPWRSDSARSATVSVTAYRWRDVNTVIDAYEGVASFADPATIDGATYPRSIVIDADSQGEFQGGYFEVDLVGRRCAAFDATVGALDGNAEGSEVGVEVRADTDLIAEDSYMLGDSERLTLDVRGADRLRVDAVVVVEGPQGELGVGTPRLLCAS